MTPDYYIKLMKISDLSLYIPDNVHPSMEGLEIVVYPVLKEVLK